MEALIAIFFIVGIAFSIKFYLDSKNKDSKNTGGKPGENQERK